MQFGDAIKNGFQNYANFRGVASRSEFWYWYLFSYVIVSIVASIIDSSIGLVLGIQDFALVDTLTALALLLPNLAVAVRRFHDAGFSAWWYSIPQVAVIVAGIVFMVTLINYLVVTDSLLLDALESSTFLNDLFDWNSTLAADFAYAIIASNALPSFVVFVLLGFATFVFTIIIYVLPTRSVEAGNRHNKPQVAPFKIAG